MKKTAIVRFIGKQEDYTLESGKLSRKNNKQQHFVSGNDGDNKGEKYQFKYGHLYNAYFLEFWQDKRNNLHVKGENGKIDYFYELEDFEIVTDEDHVLNNHEAIVRCITHEFDDEIVYITYGREYRVLGFSKDGAYLVMDDSYMCYFYSPKFFEIISDEHGVLDKGKSLPVYDWENTHIDSV